MAPKNCSGAYPVLLPAQRLDELNLFPKKYQSRLSMRHVDEGFPRFTGLSLYAILPYTWVCFACRSPSIPALGTARSDTKREAVFS